MNLIEARKLGHEGWVRSASTGDVWIRLDGMYFYKEDGTTARTLQADLLDLEDWEPKPKPAEPLEVEVWVSTSGHFIEATEKNEDCYGVGWRKIRVREVLE